MGVARQSCLKLQPVDSEPIFVKGTWFDSRFDLSITDGVNAWEEVVRKTQSFERLKVEAELCLIQSEKIANEKIEFESAIYSKFLGVLNSKKAKLRELRNKISKLEAAGKLPEQEESTGQTETYVSDDKNR